MTSFDHVLKALLWSSTDEDYQPLDSGYYTPSEELILKLHQDWTTFVDKILATGFNPEAFCIGSLSIDCGGDVWAQVAHDYIMTRNRHGCGFWEVSDWEPAMGDILCKWCREAGPFEVYVGDDNLIHPM
jgi:hypothetical protein